MKNRELTYATEDGLVLPEWSLVVRRGHSMGIGNGYYRALNPRVLKYRRSLGGYLVELEIFPW